MLPYGNDTECVAGQGGTHPVDDLVGTNRGPKTAAIAQEGGGGQASHAPRTLAHDTHATPSTTHHIPTSTYAARIAKTGSAHLGLAALCPLATSPSHITVIVSRTAAHS